MELIIGRDANTSQLKITSSTQTKLVGTVSSVPMSVSRQHCKIVIGDGGSMVISNLRVTNETFVNGLSVQSKQISFDDDIELGQDRYVLDWNAIKNMIPQTADIRSLKKIWEEYDKHRMDQQIADRKFNTLRGTTGLVTMTAIAMAMLLGHGIVYIIIYSAAIILSFAFTIKAYRDATSVPQKMKRLQDDFKHDYVCPQCGHHYNMDYDELVKYDSCPFCKTPFLK